MRKHDRIAALGQTRIDELERRIDELTAELEHQRTLAAQRSHLDALNDALLGALDPELVVETTQRQLGDALRRTCVVLRDSRNDAPAALPFEHALCVAIGTADVPMGWLCVAGPELNADERVLAGEAADRVGRALAAALVVSGRSHVLGTLERSLLPDALLPLPGLQLASRYLPATGAHDVGGDFYDAVRHGDRITLIVGDVQGKGAEAATLTSLARHTLRASALADHAPAALLEHLNTALLYGQAEQLHAGQDPLLRFVTAAVATLEPVEGGFLARVARAGQPPPVIVRSAGTFQHVEPKGVLLGVCQDPVFEEESIELAEGDTIILYTDGVIEQRHAMNPFSERHLGLLVRNRRNVVDAEATAQLIEDTVQLITHDDVRDDVAILVACVTPKVRR
ncbi:MAG TPA: PP2C family protein-serine/threonine phosphatase [Acidimicrobiales bacterium]